MTRAVAIVAIAWAAALACGTPPSSPVNAGVPAIAPAHASPDPPPARPIIVEDAATPDAATPDAGSGDADGIRD